ncbi:OmpA family protein [Lihuaxuella thermophila]|uniref:Outer membrane protein OmpA n=1 Tax=Lihuaxuella thermophila TaxID=1173111 RepID=A0A1H8HRN4_9BACL|nr:OmpA family protein [Lihuaxuella thermophila]SEN58719.1 Outer membrane protein OmpA [Lihuaxuella thermophila]
MYKGLITWFDVPTILGEYKVQVIREGKVLSEGSFNVVENPKDGNSQQSQGGITNSRPVDTYKKLTVDPRPMTFGDWPKDENKKSLDNIRKYFDPSEKISLDFDEPDTLKTDKLIIRLLRVRAKGEFHNWVRGWEQKVEPSYKGLMLTFHDPVWNGELEPGEYRVRIYRDLELMADETFNVVGGLKEASQKQKHLNLPNYVGVTFNKDQVKINVPEPLLFSFNKSDLKPQAQETLDEVALVLKQYSNAVVKVYGYTDSLGEEDYNLKLSQKRAATVESYLKSRGLQGVQFDTRGFGEMNPKESNDTIQGRQKNRRVEIIIDPR